MTVDVLNPGDPYNLLRIGEAWRNRPGLTTILITYAAFALLLVLGSTGGTTLFWMCVALGMLSIVIGVSAAGMQFMDQAAGRVVSPVLTALVGSPMVILRSLGLFLVWIVVFLIYLAVASIILFVCKVPGLGAVVYAIALPVLTFVGALIFLGLTVSGLISGAALWEGHSLSAALVRVWAISTQRPMQAYLRVVMLSLAVTLVMLIIVGFIFAGFVVAVGLSAAILGSDIADSASSLMGSFGGGFDWQGSGDAMIYAGLIGGALVVAVVQALFTAFFALGLSLTYLKVTEGIDLTTAQAAVDSAIVKTKEKAQQAAAEAKRRAQEAQAAAQQRADHARKPQPAPGSSPISSALTCPKCGAAVAPDGAFCGDCGHKLI